MPLLTEALRAIDGAVALGKEGDLGHLATVVADGGVHLVGCAPAEAGEGPVVDVALGKGGTACLAAGAT